MAGVSDGETHDAILGGAFHFVQPRRGYRFSIEAILLARFATVKPRDRMLELGAGCGVVAILMAALRGVGQAVAVEIQPAMASLAERNVQRNGTANVSVICADLRARRIAGLELASFDLVIANPPFRAILSGRASPEAARQIARGENAATLADFAISARRYARNGARVAFVFTASRMAELIATLRDRGLEPKRVRLIHPRVSLPASAVLIEARAGGRAEVEIEPPLVLHDGAGRYTDEACAMLSTP